MSWNGSTLDAFADVLDTDLFFLSPPDPGSASRPRAHRSRRGLRTSRARLAASSGSRNHQVRGRHCGVLRTSVRTTATLTLRQAVCLSSKPLVGPRPCGRGPEHPLPRKKAGRHGCYLSATNCGGRRTPGRHRRQNKYRYRTVTFAGTYTTGGDAVTPARLGFRSRSLWSRSVQRPMALSRMTRRTSELKRRSSFGRPVPVVPGLPRRATASR